MTDVGRMSMAELVGKVLADEHADVLRQAVCWLAQELMEAEVTTAAGAGSARTRSAASSSGTASVGSTRARSRIRRWASAIESRSATCAA